MLYYISLFYFINNICHEKMIFFIFYFSLQKNIPYMRKESLL